MLSGCVLISNEVLELISQRTTAWYQLSGQTVKAHEVMSMASAQLLQLSHVVTLSTHFRCYTCNKHDSRRWQCQENLRKWDTFKTWKNVWVAAGREVSGRVSDLFISFLCEWNLFERQVTNVSNVFLLYMSGYNFTLGRHDCSTSLAEWQQAAWRSLNWPDGILVICSMPNISTSVLKHLKHQTSGRGLLVTPVLIFSMFWGWRNCYFCYFNNMLLIQVIPRHFQYFLGIGWWIAWWVLHLGKVPSCAIMCHQRMSWHPGDLLEISESFLSFQLPEVCTAGLGLPLARTKRSYLQSIFCFVTWTCFCFRFPQKRYVGNHDKGKLRISSPNSLIGWHSRKRIPKRQNYFILPYLTILDFLKFFREFGGTESQARCTAKQLVEIATPLDHSVSLGSKLQSSPFHAFCVP